MTFTHLESSEADDFEAEQVLHSLMLGGDEMALKAACWAILTAECFPPRLGAAYAAVQQVSAHPGWRDEFWSRILSHAGSWTSAQLANWLSGHYYFSYTKQDFEKFVELTGSIASSHDRRCVAVMLFTWRRLGEDEARVLQFMDVTSRSGSGASGVVHVGPSAAPDNEML
ncbi:hypothetical protein [Verrucomicrobium sp. BvORR106]|uniref:hypothetical protein n=1 Tax=Verrucomicrobium sp. BvORR106 TaxID=1403819 RepID=UPI00056F4F30|nr:hypothetical protein [Verrucomicrobium sp. BvORR106]